MGDRPKVGTLSMDDVLGVLRTMGVKVVPTTNGHWKVHGPKGVAVIADSGDWRAMENSLTHLRQHAGIDIKKRVADEMLRRNTARLEKKRAKAERAAAREAELEAQAARARERAERDKEQAMGGKESKKVSVEKRGFHARIVNYMKERPNQTVTTDDIQKHLDCTRTQANVSLAYACRVMPEVRRSGHGIYRWVPLQGEQQPAEQPEVSATNGHKPESDYGLWEEVKTLADGRLLLQDPEGTLYVATMTKVEL